MKRTLILLFPFLAFSLSGCFKEFNGYNDDNELLARLSRGSGTWQVTKVEQWNASEKDPVVTTFSPEDSYFHFYLRSKIVFGTVIQLTYGEYFEANALVNEAIVSAQNERIVFEGNTVGSGLVYTIEEKGRTKFVWLFMANDKATRYYVEKCNCELPITTLVETGG